jgi:hypothetical protein
MSFQDIEAGVNHPSRSPSSTSNPQDAQFLSLQSSLSLQVFKMNANVQGILKLVDQLGTAKDSASLRKSLCVSKSFTHHIEALTVNRHDLTETTRAMAKRGSEDLKKLSGLQSSLVRVSYNIFLLGYNITFSRIRRPHCKRHLMTCSFHWLRSSVHSKSAQKDKGQLFKESN